MASFDSHPIQIRVYCWWLVLVEWKSSEQLDRPGQMSPQHAPTTTTTRQSPLDGLFDQFEAPMRKRRGRRHCRVCQDDASQQRSFPNLKRNISKCVLHQKRARRGEPYCLIVSLSSSSTLNHFHRIPRISASSPTRPPHAVHCWNSWKSKRDRMTRCQQWYIHHKKTNPATGTIKLARNGIQRSKL